jgi:hypothetical protein
MDARSPSLSNWPTRNLKPARALDDVELVQFHSDATFKSARGAWSRDISRMGSPDFANMIVVCWTVSGYMGFARGAVAFPDQSQIAADLGWSLSTVRRALELAEAWGWLTKVRRPLQTNIYRMSFSRSVRETIDLEHTNRVAEFRVEAAKKRVVRDTLRSVRSERQETSDMTEPFAQVWTNGSFRSERLSSSSSTPPDPHQLSTERLGEGEQNIGDDAEQKKAALDEVISMLGRGDMAAGRRIANGLLPARLAHLVRMVDDEGMVAAASLIIEARDHSSAGR